MSKSFFYCCLLASLICFAQSNRVAAFESLPPILEFYPACDYKVVESYSLSREVKRNRQKANTTKMLEAIRRQAQDKGADAVILTNVQALNPETSTTLVSTSLPAYPKANKKSIKVIVTADLITHCQELKLDTSQPTPYSAQGEKRAQEVFRVKIEREALVVQLPSVKKFSHINPQSNIVSIEQGIYGLNLGATREEIIAAFGMPSIETRILKRELVLGFGRRHWLHLQDNRLVKVSTENTLFDDAFLNLIPLRDVFDEFQWTINDSVRYKSDLATVTTALGVKNSHLRNNEVTLNNGTKTFKLLFSSRNDLENENKVYSLSGFSLQTNDYVAGGITPFDSSKQFKILTKLYQKLITETFENELTTINLMGEPLAKIYLSGEEQSNIYNDHLIITTKRNSITKLHIIAELFNNKIMRKSEEQVWSLDKMTEGDNLDVTLAKLPDDAYAGDLKIEVDTDTYQANFLFNDKNKRSQLEEVEIILY